MRESIQKTEKVDHAGHGSSRVSASRKGLFAKIEDSPRSDIDTKMRAAPQPDTSLQPDTSPKIDAGRGEGSFSKADMTEKKLSGLLGLAERASRIRSGEFAAEASIKSRKAFLCIVARDASERTKKHFSDMCSFRNIPFISLYINKNSLGHAIGRDERSVLTIEDRGFSRQVIEIVKGGNACGK